MRLKWILTAIGLCAVGYMGSLTPREAREMALEGFGLLADSTSTSCSLKRGLELTRRAADAGDPVSLNNLAYLFESGRLADTADSTGHALMAVDLDSAAFYYGAALDRNLTSAAINLLNLAEGHPEVEVPSGRIAAAHMALGKAYALGNTVLPYDYGASQRHFLAAARLGNPKAREIVREILGQFPDAFPELTPTELDSLFSIDN